MFPTMLSLLLAADCAALLPNQSLASPEAPVAANSTMRVSMKGGEPAGEARVQIYKIGFRDQGEVISRQSTTNGECEFSRLSAGSYLVLARTKTHIAARDVYVEDDQALPVVLHMKPAVKSHVVVLDPEGRPSADAQLQTLTLQNESGSCRLTPRQAAGLGLEWQPSDAQGKLQLPLLPDGAQLELVISHPDFPQRTHSGLETSPGFLDHLRFQPGVKLQLSFDAVGGAEMPKEVRVMLFPQAGSPGTELRSVPFPLDAQGHVSVPVKPGHYGTLQFDLSQNEDYCVAPFFMTDVEVSATQPWKLSCRVYRKVKVTGRVLDTMGKPVPEARVHAEVAAPFSHAPWSHIEWAETDAGGDYSVHIAPSASRVSIEAQGYARIVRNVDAAAGMRLPDVTLKLLPPVTGTVRDAQGAPVSKAVVTFTGRLRLFAPAITDSAGRFELKPVFIPVDRETGQDAADCFVCAMDPHESRHGHTPVRIGDVAGSTNLEIVLRRGSAADPITRPDDLLPSEKPGASGSETSLLLGKPAPELDCVTWLNGEREHYTLADFRGKFVLIDLWATWCGPCHTDFPKLEWLHEAYRDRGLVVIGLHDNSVPVEGIRAHVAREKLDFLVAIDHPDGRTVTRYKAAGMHGYPSYLLIDPQGTVIEMDDVTGRPNLRLRMLSLVRSHILQHAQQSQSPR